MMRWSKLSESSITSPITICPSRTTGFCFIWCTPRMPTSGKFKIGVAKRPPCCPSDVMVKVEPCTSSSFDLPSRASRATRSISLATPSSERRSASLMTGTVSPASVEVAMPML